MSVSSLIVLGLWRTKWSIVSPRVFWLLPYLLVKTNKTNYLHHDHAIVTVFFSRGVLLKDLTRSTGWTAADKSRLQQNPGWRLAKDAPWRLEILFPFVSMRRGARRGRFWLQIEQFKCDWTLTREISRLSRRFEREGWVGLISHSGNIVCSISL